MLLLIVGNKTYADVVASNGKTFTPYFVKDYQLVQRHTHSGHIMKVLLFFKMGTEVC